MICLQYRSYIILILILTLIEVFSRVINFLALFKVQWNRFMNITENSIRCMDNLVQLPNKLLIP